tara:strand:+ start:24981 stop:25196 length:216 start_codon:yes stop_codon:yes gene_type:complete
MAKVKDGIVHSLADGKAKENIKHISDAVSGDVAVDFELKDGSSVKLNLPTTDPEVDGQLWSDSGAVKVSAG